MSIDITFSQQISYISILRKIFYKYKFALFLLTTFCCSANAFAQQTIPWSYQYYNTTHGLPSTQIICLAKDSKGFLWIGTAAGISMYDGYSFKNYAYTNKHELIGYVNTIKAGADNRLWIGTGAGLFCCINNEVIKVSAATLLPQGVNDILPEINGTIWLATENGPAKFSSSDVDFTGNKKILLTSCLLKQWKVKNEMMESPRTVLISNTSDGTIYIATDNSLYRLINDTLGIIYITTQVRNKITTLFPVSKSLVYFDAASTEINKIDNGNITHVNPETLYKPGTENRNGGKWYVGTRGAYNFHADDGSISGSVSFSDKYIVWPTAILKENDFLWVATSDGLVKIKPSIFTAYELDKKSHYNDYYSITALRNGKLLLGTNAGKIYEKKGSVFSLYKDNLFPGAEVKGLYEDENGWLWVASGYQGLAVIRNGNAERFTIENGLHDNSVYQFYKSVNGKLYVFGDRGMSEIIVGGDKSISFKKYYYQPNISRHAKFFSGIEGPDGSIWLGGEEGIVYLRNESLHQFIFKDKQIFVNFLIKDKEDNVWIATAGEGILQCVFNKKNELEIVQQFTESDGLNTMHYLSLLTDKEHNIWAGSSNGITVIGRAGRYKNRVLNYNESDGFIKSGYSSMALYQDVDDEIWAASTLGFISFDPGRLSPSEVPPVVYVTGIRQIKSNLLINGNALHQSAANQTFKYFQNSLSFTFTALDFANQQNMRYYYQLAGAYTGWVNSGNQRSISFENLSPGTYSFRVKALNSKGVWSKEDAVYTFTITQPFWKTWWFILSSLGAIALLTILLIRRRISFVKKREREKTVLQQLRAINYKEQLEIEQIINHFATTMNNVNSIDEVLWDVAKNCISKLNFEDCVIYLKDDSRNLLIQKAAWGPKTTAENKIINPIEISVGKGITGNVALTGIAEIIADTALDERYIVDDINRLSEIAVPIINKGKVLGVIDSEHSQKNFYTERHLQILNTIASLCAGKIDMIRAEQQTREKEMEVLRLNKDVATSQLTALRMQMNPHFIFNALNSVQHYILQGNVVEANKYLSKFSKLQREILHCSNQQFITLEKEIEILNAYLQLEQFRFGESFTYQVNMTNEIEPVEIKIPPMMMQPFVENAIWHGLMPRQTDRTLAIYFDLYTEDILLATIRDNGIGRAASALLKYNNGERKPGHQSKGMSMVQQRLQLLQQQYDKPFDATITDITDVNGFVQGTQVTLKIFIGDKKS